MEYLNKLQELRERSGMTYQQIADASNVPVSTVSRIFSGQTDNPTMQTVAAMVQVMGGSLDEVYGMKRPMKAEEKMDALQFALQSRDEMIQHLKAQIEEKNKWIHVLSIVVGVVVVFILFVLAWDITHPDMGYIQYAQAQFNRAMNLIHDIFKI